MKIKIIPLSEQLQCCCEYRPVHPEYVPALLHSIAGCPAGAYFASCPEALEELKTILSLDAGPAPLTYSDLARTIQELWLEDPQSAGRAVRLLAAPLLRMYKANKRKEQSNE